VAFHTSIYGMVFSLVFNFVYKRILDDAELTVRDFLGAFKKYVLPDTEADGINRLIELEQKQTETMVAMSDRVTRLLSDGLREILEPQFNRFNDTIIGFANMATKNQMDQLTMVVNSFITQMNASLGNMFTKLSETVDNTIAIQSENEKQITKILEKNTHTSENINLILVRTKEMADALKLYADTLQELQGRMSATADMLRQQREDDRQVLDGISGYIAEIENYRKDLNTSVQMADTSMKSQARMVTELKEMTDQLPEDVRDTFEVINANLQKVETHFKETIEQMHQVLSRMSGQIEYSYNGIEQGFLRTAKSIDELAGFMQRLEEYYMGNR
ncbi:MAG: hypothetical protein K6E63_11270, partial [Lachnospiraceae bacterium]|nr:hypothetical protein [Lachnospiraceae bacterium]